MESATVRVCGRLAYDGTAYHGFQAQAGVPTVQGTLETALVRFAQLHGRVAGAGRTDAGVHATGQVIAVEVAWRHPVASLQAAWNAHLPPDMVVYDLVEAPAGFHPRFSAYRRTYRYTVVVWETSGARRWPLADRFAWTVTRPLDLGAMNRAAAQWVGTHDFATFGRPTQGESTVRTVTAAQWEVIPAQHDPPDSRRLVFTITANGFLHNMVRCLVGTCVAVGQGEWTPTDVAEALAARDRRRTAPPAPPQGLVLEQVAYPPAYDPWFTVSGQAAREASGLEDRSSVPTTHRPVGQTGVGYPGQEE